MAGVQRARLPAPESRPYLAFGAALGVDLLMMLFILIPLFWPIFVLAIGPYLGGRVGGRYAARREASYAGGIAAASVVTLLAAILVYVLGQFPGSNFTLLEPIGLTIIVAGYLVAILFGALGGRHGASTRARARKAV